MRAYPLCRIERSTDGQRFEPMSDADSRALCDELTRCWAFVPNQPEAKDEHLSIDGAPFVPATPEEMVDAVVRALERGGHATLHFSETFALYLRRAAPAPGALDYALGQLEYATRERFGVPQRRYWGG